MEKMLKNLAVIPARSGSKGLKDKNIKYLNDKPLMAYSIDAACQSGCFDVVHVSTDSKDYAEIATAYGADVPFLRAEELATDTAGTWNTVRFVIGEYEKRGISFETVTVLQPTSPLRRPEDIQNAFRIFTEKDANAVVSVSPAEHSPMLMNTLDETGSLERFFDRKNDMRRQDMEQYYRINGAVYIVKTDIIKKGNTIYSSKSYAYIMEKQFSVDIDDEFDFRMAEYYINSVKEM